MMTDFGEILKIVGDFGRFQKCLVLQISLGSFSIAFHMFGQLFMVMDVPHHCDTSWIHEISPNLSKEQQLNLTIPWNTPGSYEECHMYTPVERDIDSILQYGFNSTEKCQNGWVYPSGEEQTLVTQFDLVCDRKGLHDISMSIYKVGLLLGALVSGSLSDRIGRRPVTLFSMLIMGAFGIGAAFAPDFYVYMALRCLVGVAVSGFAISTVTLGAEWAGVSYRTHTVVISHCSFSIGQMTLAGLAYGVRNWKLLQIAGSAPVLCLFFYIWFVNSLVYYGLSLNVGNFGLDIYWMQFVFGAVGIPACLCCSFLLQWFGRKKCQCSFLLLGGVMMLLITSIPQDLPVVVTTLAAVGRFAITVSLSTSYVYCAELFPTVLRQTSLGLCSMSARAGGIISPLIGLLDKYHPSISMAIFGSTPVIGGILCFLLPETCGKELQDHMEEAVAGQRSCEKVNSSYEIGYLTVKEDGQSTGHTRVTRL